MNATMLQERERVLALELNAAFAANDASRFQAALNALLATRESAIHSEAARLSGALHEALARFRREPLEKVVRLTEEAAHRTLDLIERSVPLADEIARGAAELARAPVTSQTGALNRFLEQARDNCEAVRTNLAQVVLAQGFQDITGQIIGRVHRLSGEAEVVLADLMRLLGIPHTEGSGGRRESSTPESGTLRDQHEVDALMAALEHR